jgi:hypothetical protein
MPDLSASAKFFAPMSKSVISVVQGIVHPEFSKRLVCKIALQFFFSS